MAQTVTLELLTNEYYWKIGESGSLKTIRALDQLTLGNLNDGNPTTTATKSNVTSSLFIGNLDGNVGTLNVSGNMSGSVLIGGNGTDAITMNLELELDNVNEATFGSFGNQVAIPSFNVDKYGRISNVSTSVISTTLKLLDTDGSTGSVDLLNNNLKINGTPNQIISSVLGNVFSLSLDNDVNINNLSLTGNLEVDGATTLNSSLDVVGAATLNSSLDVVSTCSLYSTLQVEGASSMESSLYVVGATTINSSLNVVSASSFDSTLNVDGAVSLNSSLIVTGESTYLNNILATKDVTVQGNIYVRGNLAKIDAETIVLSDPLIVLGNTNMSGIYQDLGFQFIKDSNSDNYGYFGWVGLSNEFQFYETAEVNGNDLITANSTLGTIRADTFKANVIEATLFTGDLLGSASNLNHYITVDFCGNVFGDISFNGSETELIVSLELESVFSNVGTYGNNLSIPTITVDKYGRVTSVIENTISTSLNLLDTNGNTGIVDLLNEELKIEGTSRKIDVIVSGNTFSLTLPNNLSMVDVSMSGMLEVNGATTINSSLQVVDATTMNSTFDVIGVSSLHSTLQVEGASSIESTLQVVDATTMNSTLYVDGASSIESTLQVVDATTMNSTLNVIGASSIESTLQVVDATTMNSTLDIVGASSLHSTLEVEGASSIKSTLQVVDATTMNSTLDVVGASLLHSTLQVEGASSIKSTLEVVDAVTMNSTLHIVGATSLESSLYVGDNVNLNKNLTIQGNLIVHGSETRINVETLVIEDNKIELNTDGDLQAFGIFANISQHGENISLFYEPSTFRWEFSKDLYVSGNLSTNNSATINDTLQVINSTTLNSTLDVVSGASLYSTLQVGEATTIEKTLQVVDAATMNSSLDIVGATSLHNILEVAANITTPEYLIKDNNSSNSIKLIAPDLSSGSYTLTLPTDDGITNQFLQTNGSGILSWVTPDNAKTIKSNVINNADYTTNTNSPIELTAFEITYNTTVANSSVMLQHKIPYESSIHANQRIIFTINKIVNGGTPILVVSGDILGPNNATGGTRGIYISNVITETSDTIGSSVTFKVSATLTKETTAVDIYGNSKKAGVRVGPDYGTGSVMLTEFIN